MSELTHITIMAADGRIDVPIILPGDFRPTRWYLPAALDALKYTSPAFVYNGYDLSLCGSLLTSLRQTLTGTRFESSNDLDLIAVPINPYHNPAGSVIAMLRTFPPVLAISEPYYGIMATAAYLVVLRSYHVIDIQFREQNYKGESNATQNNETTNTKDKR